jgi:hypothetical protein
MEAGASKRALACIVLHVIQNNSLISKHIEVHFSKLLSWINFIEDKYYEQTPDCKLLPWANVMCLASFFFST